MPDRRQSTHHTFGSLISRFAGLQQEQVAQVETTQEAVNPQEFLENFDWHKYEEGIEAVDESQLKEFEKACRIASFKHFPVHSDEFRLLRAQNYIAQSLELTKGSPLHQQLLRVQNATNAA